MVCPRTTRGSEAALPAATAVPPPPGLRCQETYAWGLRNPFRFGFDPNAPGVRFLINDVGQDTWEEIDLGSPGADYGWNLREGPCATGSLTDCGTPPAGLTDPVYSYDHTSGCKAITGGAFVPDGVWPAELDGAYLFGDYVCGKIFTLTPSGTGFASSDFASGLGEGSAITFLFGATGAGDALYYTTYAEGGQVRKIEYVGAGNRTPVAGATATPNAGALPLDVSFDASASSDADGDPLTYTWNFGDGSPPVTTSAPQTTHRYVQAGTRSAQLFVTDPSGARSAIATVRVDPGRFAPSVRIDTPAPSKLFAVGERIELRGSASDPEDGTLPSSALTWEVLLQHDDHTHPYLQRVAGNAVSIVAPQPENLTATRTSWLIVKLSARDSDGLTTTVTQLLKPNLADVTIGSSPPNVTIRVNGVSVTAPSTLTSWQGYRLDLAAPTTTTVAGTTYAFERWSDGNTSPARSVTTPASAIALTAIYADGGGGGNETTAVFAAGAEDGFVEVGGPSYPPTAAATTTLSSDSSILLVRRSQTPFSYSPVSVALLRFDTSSLPDNATITSAALSVHVTDKADSNGRNLTAEWYPPAQWPIDASDWTATDTNNAHTGTPLSAISSGQQNSFNLTSLSNLNRSGNSALRLHISGAATTPTDANDLILAAQDHPTLPAPTLTVRYTTGSPPPPPPPPPPDETTAVFAAGAEDGFVEVGGPSYPPTAAATTTLSSDSSILLVRRSQTPFSYSPVSVALLRFDTSSLPDNATITSAALSVHVTDKADSNGRNLTAEWYPPAQWPIDASDWTATDTNNAHTGTPLSAISSGQQNSFNLTSLSNLNRSGNSALRLHISGAATTPTDANDLILAAQDHPTLPAPTLTVRYTTGSPPPPPPPPPPDETTAVFAAGAEDGFVEVGGPSYPPTAAATTTLSSDSSILLVRRSQTPFSYSPVSVALLRFDTSSLPDNATITSAALSVHVTDKADSNGRNLTAEWYPPAQWPIDASDWTATDTNNAHTGTPLSAISSGQQNSFNLTSLSNLNRSGNSALRLHISGAATTPTDANDLILAAQDHPTLPAPMLVITYR